MGDSLSPADCWAPDGPPHGWGAVAVRRCRCKPVRGWKDYDQPLVDGAGHDVDLDDADRDFMSRVRPEQMGRAA